MEAVLDHLLRADAQTPPLETLQAWWQTHRELRERFALPVDVAIAAGFAADRLAYAFGSGYQAAGQALCPRLAGAGIRAFCATEGRSAHPRSIETKLHADHDGQLLLNGHKSFVTFGSQAELLLVVASEGVDADGRNRLRLVAIEPREGVSFNAVDTLPFVPEIPHSSVTLEDVAVAPNEVLEGDGYQRYLKPFRTVEDCHVNAAFVGWLIKLARRFEWPNETLQHLTAAVVGIRALATADAHSPAVHIALSGALSRAGQLVKDIEPLWAQVDDATRQRWQRDRPLLAVARKVRHKRTASAWRDLGRPEAEPDQD